MEVQEAHQKGYRFTGSYERDKTSIKTKQKFKYAGFKTVLVPERASGYERNGSKKGQITGYSIYAEEKYFIARRKGELENRIGFIPSKLEKLKDEYEKKKAEMLLEEENMKAELELLNK